MVNVNRLTHSAVSATPSTTCTPGASTLTGTVSGGILPYMFNWSNGNNTEDITNLAAGNYIVCVQDNNNCSVCDTFTVLSPTTGIIESQDAEISVYPNPFNLYTTVRFNYPQTKSSQIEILNSMGQIIFETDPEAQGYGPSFLTPIGLNKENGKMRYKVNA